MGKQIFITLHSSKIWLDKQREIDGYTVDGFYTMPNITGKSVEVVFFNWQAPNGYENKCAYEIPTEIRSQCYVKMITKVKRMQFVDGKVVISVCGKKYWIGTYTENEKEC